MVSNILKKSKTKTKKGNYDFLKKIDLITSASKFGFFFEDTENKIYHATEQLLLISNVPTLADSEEAVRIFSERIDSKYRKQVINKIKQFYNGKLEDISEIFEFHRSVEEIIWIHLNIIVEKRDDSSKKPIKVIGYLHDITSQKEIEYNLNHSAKLESIGLMACGIAHEINNPLAIISALNQKIKKNIGTLSVGNSCREEMAKDLIKVDSTINRISKIIQDVKYYSRDSTNENYELISLQNLIDDLIRFSENRMNQKNIKFMLECKVLGLKLYCQKTALSQVLINLINNSIDAIEQLEEKWINLKIEKNENTIRLAIIDSGKGIDLNIQGKIMSPFFTTKEVGKGTGIGLGICLSIIRNHQGKFFLEKNAINTTFIIELPSHESFMPIFCTDF